MTLLMTEDPTEDPGATSLGITISETHFDDQVTKSQCPAIANDDNELAVEV